MSARALGRIVAIAEKKGSGTLIPGCNPMMSAALSRPSILRIETLKAVGRRFGGRRLRTDLTAMRSRWGLSLRLGITVEALGVLPISEILIGFSHVEVERGIKILTPCVVYCVGAVERFLIPVQSVLRSSTDVLRHSGRRCRLHSRLCSDPRLA